MSNQIEKSFTVSGKRVTVIYDLTFYSEKEYRRDFRDFLNYQKRKEEFSESDEGDWKFYNLKQFKSIPFNDFLKIVSDLFSRVIYQVLKDNPTIMVSDQNEFKVKIILFRVPGREWYMEEHPREELKGEQYSQFLEELESEEIEHADHLTAGSFLIQSIAAPWFYKKRIDYSYIYRFLFHELEHHKQRITDFYKFEDEVQKRLEARFKTKVPKIMNYRITYLFLTMHGLLNEGHAEFVASTNQPKIDIHMDWIYKFRRDLDALTTMIGKNKIHEFWVENLAYGVFAGGAYYCGKIMCFTIELAFAKRMDKQPLIYLQNREEYPLEAIDNIISKQKVFYVGNPEYIVFKRTYDEIAKTNYDYRKFIALYEWACKELGLRKRNMIMWYGFYDDLKKKATKFYERYSKNKRAEMYKKIKSIIRTKYSVE